MESVQGDITPHMRSILVDWLVEVAQEYRLASDTLFLTVAYVDRFLSLVDVPRNKLQLVSPGRSCAACQPAAVPACLVQLAR
jgi:cyclin A